VDAALDLSHTKNIGRMIKTHFPHSQFIVVLFKKGMFNNANVLFRTICGRGVKAFCSTDCRYKQMMLEGDEILEPELNDVYGTNSRTTFIRVNGPIVVFSLSNNNHIERQMICKIICT
ncbi:structural maintenance of chromosomes protein 2-1, partial [Phtheirospermum japonicum]